jgi:hypothetical protein
MCINMELDGRGHLPRQVSAIEERDEMPNNSRHSSVTGQKSCAVRRINVSLISTTGLDHRLLLTYLAYTCMTLMTLTKLRLCS